MSTPTSLLRRLTTGRLFSRHLVWTWGSIVVSLLVCAAILWIHSEERWVLRQAIASLEELRQARIDLAKGFLNVALASDASSSSDLVEGMASVRKAISSLHNSVRMAEKIHGRSKTLEVEVSAAALRSKLESFQRSMEEWSEKGANDPQLEANLRQAFSQLERRADIFDGQVLRSLLDRSRSLDHAFMYTLTAAVLLLAGLCVPLFFIGRAQKESAAAFQSSEQRLRILVRSIPDLVWLKDPEGVYLACNQRFERFFGAKEAEIVGKTDYDFVDTELADFFREHDRKAMAAGRPSINEEWIQFADDGHRELLETIKTPIRDSEGRLIGVLGIARDITGLREAQEALREREEVYSAIVNQAADSIVLIDVETLRFVEFNDTTCNNLGYLRDEFSALRVPDVEAVDEPDMAVERVLEIVAAGGYSYETRFRRKNREIRDVWVSAKPLTIRGRQFLAAVCRDVTERKRAEESLRYHELLLRDVGRVAKIGGWEFDPATGKGTWTEEVARIHDLDPADETSVEKGLSFYHGESLAKIEKAVKEAVELGKPYDLELEMITAKGNHKWVKTIGRPMIENGKVVQVRGALQDITENVELSKQLQQAQKMEAVGTLAGGIAHDFNNILQVVLGYSDLILGDEELPVHYRADLQRIHESARRGADLVQRLLTFSRKTEIKLQPLNLNRRIGELKKMLGRTIPKMIDIQISPGDRLATISADPTQMDQVLMNLALNARDAMPDGGTLIVETSNIMLDEEYTKTHLDARPGNHVLLKVTDTGAGMNEDTLEHIFEPFYTTKGVGEGSGLGLAMVHGIVKHHGGHIRCHSYPGKGTTFEIYFPALAADKATEPTIVRQIHRGGSETVLLVDDEEFIRDLGSRALTKAGYKVITASNGKEALRVYQEHGSEIALVLLDLIMPEMGGKQCLEGLLRLNSSVKVVIASGYSGGGPTMDPISAGARGSVKKPFDILQVLEVVRQVLDGE